MKSVTKSRQIVPLGPGFTGWLAELRARKPSSSSRNRFNLSAFCFQELALNIVEIVPEKKMLKRLKYFKQRMRLTNNLNEFN
jgi:hypothetical protein